MDGTETLSKLEVDLEFYKGINSKAQKKLLQLEKMASRKPKKQTKGPNKGCKIMPQIVKKKERPKNEQKAKKKSTYIPPN